MRKLLSSPFYYWENYTKTSSRATSSSFHSRIGKIPASSSHIRTQWPLCLSVVRRGCWGCCLRSQLLKLLWKQKRSKQTFRPHSHIYTHFHCSSISFSESSLLQKNEEKAYSEYSFFLGDFFSVNGFEALSLKPKSKDFQTYFGNTYFMSTPHCSKSLFLAQKFRWKGNIYESKTGFFTWKNIRLEAI